MLRSAEAMSLEGNSHHDRPRESSMLKLHIEDDEGQETVVPIIRDEITIGRQEGNTIRLTERNVSRRHARILRQSDQIFVEEISARYGVYKNGEKIQERSEFNEGDVFLIGDYRLTIQPDKAKVMEEAPLNGAASDMASEPTAIKPLPSGPSRVSEGTEILPAMPAKLVIISSNFAGQEFPLEHREVVIGRGEDCDIIIDHRSVSQNHAKIVRDKTANYQIIDLNSKNGVRISGDKYTSTHLKRGDIVELGHVKFRFVEPGENYVFTPQSIVDDEPTPSSSATPSSGGRNPLMIPGIIGIVLLIAVVAIGAAFMSDDGEKKNNDANNTSVATNTTETTPEETTPEETTPESFSNEKIAEGIAAARSRLEEGDVDKAVGILEGLEYANPSASDKEAIGNLISKARKERPFQKDFIIVKDNLEKENFLEALRALKNIPSHSLFYKLLEKNGQRGKILSGVLDDADAAIADNDRARAKTLIDEVLAFDPESEDAAALQEKLEAKVASNSKPPKNDDNKKDNDRKVVKKDPKPPKLSKEEAKTLRTQANKKVIAGDYSGGISDCKKALRAGESDCHRIMAIAYMKQGKNKDACSSFQKAINTNPVNKNILESYRQKLGCE